MNYIAKNRVAYDIAALQYKERLITNTPCEVDAPTLFKFVDSFVTKTRYPINMLDIGPGNGQILRLFSNAGYETTGVDISAKMLEVARQTSPKSKFINANIMEVEFPNCCFDVIYASAIIHCFPKNDANILLGKIYSWLTNDNGILFVQTTVEKISSEGFVEKSDYKDNIIRFRKRYTEEEFRKLLIENKFSIINSECRSEPDRNKLWQCYICCP
jgi:ubiquinone/menaquinone biosynthesis C-methylase UbiE